MQHWGIMVGLMGVFMTRPCVRMADAHTFTARLKAFMVISSGQYRRPYSKGFGVAASGRNNRSLHNRLFCVRLRNACVLRSRRATIRTIR